jgi:hypothetical protein
MPATQQRERFLESTLEQLCEEADAKHQRDDPRIERVRRLLADDVSLERAWHELNTFKDRAAASTVEALMFSLRSGAGALARPDVRHRLSQLNKEQLCEVAARLLKFTAAGWTEADIEDQHVGRPWIRRRNNAPRRPSIGALGNNTEAAHLHHGRAWLRVEARRLDSDWPGILRLSEAIATWRALNDPNYSRAAA